MNNNSTNQQVAPQKKKVPSWVLGIVSIGIIILSVPIAKLFLVPAISLCGFIAGFVVAIFGLLKGIKELTLQRKIPALIGLLLCVVDLWIAATLFSWTVIGIEFFQ